MNIDIIWGRKKIRHAKVTCALCRAKTKIGHWCSSQHADKVSIKTWMKSHSYNGISFWKLHIKPPTATLASFNGVAEIQESKTSTRISQDVTEDNTKRRRTEDIDDTRTQKRQAE